ncbi:hypothetical protein [Thermomonospora amylolytica]|uniref:hypothetical protein n=1 Tax=Thermomonospora amylolytica TaxID=1411117 RepID=UPI000E6C438B|nr:hypothetical protein [Thermomonospora amylolytica]
MPEHHDSDPTDTCRIVDANGTPIRVHGTGDLDDTDRAMLGEIVAAAQRRHEQEQEQQPVTVEQAARTCPRPGCGRRKAAGHYLCTGCWWRLPRHARLALSRKDERAVRRLADLLDQIRMGVPLHKVRVQP